MERSSGGRVLFVTPITPSDAGNGLAMRAGLFLEGLSRSHPVEVLVAPAGAGRPDDLRELLSSAAGRRRVRELHPRPSLSAEATAQLARTVAERAAGFELVHVMRLYLAPLLDALLDAASRPRLSLDLDDLDADLLGAFGQAEEAEAFLRLERYYVPRVDGACVAAPGDRDLLAARTHTAGITWLPNAVPVPVPALPAATECRYDLLFVGNLSYAPNVDAARWLCGEILPLLPGVTLALAGHAPTEAVRALAQPPGVSVIADPVDIAPLYGACALAVAPLRYGGGTPIKVLEALAHARAPVVTSIAAAGLPPGLVTVADDAVAFAEACRALLADDAERTARAGAGRAFVVAERSIDVVAAQIDRWASHIIAP